MLDRKSRKIPLTPQEMWEIASETTLHQETILEEAARITAGDRQADYGPPDQDFARTAKMWEAYKGTSFTAPDVAVIMILLKISRESHQKKRDNAVDIAGYAHCLNICRESENTNGENQVSKFKVGDRVWSPSFGWGEVVAINPLSSYSLRVDFGQSGGADYTPNGLLYEDDLRPTLFHDEVKDWPNPPKPPPPKPHIEVDQPIWVRANSFTEWAPRHFKEWHGECVSCFSCGETSHTCASPPSSWKYYSLTKPEDA